jgi:DNA polymerase III subunit beta
MKTTILKNNFIKALNIIEKITGKNLTLPILDNALIETQENTLKLSTTDLEVGISYWLSANIEEKGKITIPVKTLSNLVSLISEEKINLETKEETLILKGENHKTQIKGLNAKDFPIIPEISGGIWVKIGTVDFSKAISQVIDFCALTQTRLELSGVYFYFEKNQAKIVTTDSFRLAEKTVPLTGVCNEFSPQSFILPRNAARELVNIFSQRVDELKLYLSPNQLMAEQRFSGIDQPEVRLITRLIEGDYPNYQEVIPKEHKTKIILSKEDFLNQIKKASLFSGRSNEIHLEIEPAKSSLSIAAQNVDIGETKSRIKSEVQGEKLKIAFNSKFLVEGVNQIAGEKVVLQFNGSEGPGLLKSITDNSFVYVLMPIKSS